MKGDGGTPFAENSAKIINLIFEPFPYLSAIGEIEVPIHDKKKPDMNTRGNEKYECSVCFDKKTP